jgi:hypothetical protein
MVSAFRGMPPPRVALAPFDLYLQSFARRAKEDGGRVPADNPYKLSRQRR